MRRFHTYWFYSVGVAAAWALLLLLTSIIGGDAELKRILPVFGGFCIGWLSATIARFAYPPPRRWTGRSPPTER